MSETIEPLTEEDAESKDLVQENVEKLKQIFPEIVTDGEIDFETLKEELGEFREVSDERYSFTWNGKSEARKLAMSPSRGTLRPAPEESVNWDDTDNLFIEGDNLEVLKLLQRSYHKKVKMIYIDPPYNTGNDFVYRDDYSDNLANYLNQTGQLDEEGNKISSNPEYSGRYHTDWLNMMYPRLKVARELLSEKGAIFISIGVDELANLKKIMDEIFGEENFIEIFSWEKTSTPPALSTKSRKTNEYILCYERNKNNIKYKGEPLEGGDQPLLNRGNSVRELKFPKRKVFFKGFSEQILKPYETDRVELLDEVKIENGFAQNSFRLRGEFKWTQDFLEDEIEKGTTFIIKSEKLSIRFIRDEKGFKRPRNFIKEKYTSPVINKTDSNVGTNENASSALQELMGGDYFDYPKPVSLIKYLASFVTEKDDIILDFFAGSATAAHSVLELNSEDEQNRKFIMIQLPEVLKEDDKAYEAGFDTIADFGEERIRKAINKIREENPNYDGDLGFKVLKLDSSNMKTWDPSFDDVQRSIEDSIENVKNDRSETDLLYEILLKYGIDLSLPIEERAIDDSTVYIGGAGALVLCPSDSITLDVVKGIAKIKNEYEPEVMRVVFRDSGFPDDVVKTNAIQILKQHDIEDVRSI